MVTSFFLFKIKRDSYKKNNASLVICIAFLVIGIGYILIGRETEVKYDNSTPITTIFMDEYPRESIN